ncbi:SPOSA6832_02535, partial [Sporobolomyces salmonicolor]
MAASDQVRSLPYISIQPSLPLVIADIARPGSSIAVEDCWVSCYRRAKGVSGEEEGSVHGKMRVAEGEKDGQVEVESMDKQVEVEMINESTFCVACPSLSVPPTPVLLPSPSLNSPQASNSTSSTTQEIPAPSLYTLSARGGIDCATLSSDGRRLVVGGRDGQVRVVEIVRFEDGQAGAAGAKGKRLAKGKETALRGHVGDLTAVAFFPSNEVVLTASSDMSLRIFSAIDGSSPRQLRAHTKRVTGAHILTSSDGAHKGREILSSSLDGTLKLWDVSKGEVTRTWTLSQPVSSLFVFSDAESGAAGAEEPSVLIGKYALAGHSNGTISLVSLDLSTVSSTSAGPVLTLQTFTSSSLDTLVYEPSTRLVAAGGRSGTISLFRLPSLEQATATEVQPLVEWRRTEGSSINCVRFSLHPRTFSASSSQRSPSTACSLLVAPSDGLAYRASLDSWAANAEVDVKVEEEFAGLDCEPATSIWDDAEGRVWVAGGGGDGSVRVYEREA